MNEELINENEILLKGIQKLIEEGSTFDFLKDDERIYSASDIKKDPLSNPIIRQRNNTDN